MESQTQGDDREQGRRVAVVGIGCRLPGAEDHRQFFRNLCRGENAIREITPDRWDPAEFYSPDPTAPNKSISKWCGLIDDPFVFDAGFFKISPREAKLMDPQQRILLEETWRSIEDAGIPLSDLQTHRTSVYIGVMTRDHLQRASDPEASVESHSCFGNYDFMVANRVSHVFDLRGASLSLDAACAASLVAVHAGIEELTRGEADYVLAGGVNLELHPWRSISCSKARMLSPEGQCKTFDKDADGFVPGEGVAVVLLRRLEDAERDGNHIYGVLRGSAVNHGGRRLTITAPTVESQREVIREALERARVDPRTIGYVEAHGTGTSLGDPIEIEALTEAYREHTADRQFCWIGSVKTNIGHLNAAAGVAGLIKVLGMLGAHEIPPSLNVRTPNPLIDFEASPFRIARERIAWERQEDRRPLRAGVSSFGAGGGNCHLIVEEYRPPQTPPRTPDAGPVPFLLSAKNRTGLQALVERWRSFTAEESFAESSVADIAYTLATGREPLPVRSGRVVRDLGDIRGALEALAAPEAPDGSAAAGEDPGGRPWWLSFGEVALPPAAELDRLLGREPFAAVLARLAEDPEGDPRLLERLRQGKRGVGEHCLFGILLGRVLEHYGFRPAAVTTSGRGLWSGLAAAGLVGWSTAVELASRRRRPGSVALRRPAVPFVDPASGRTIAPHTLDEPTFDALLSGLEVAPEVAAEVLGKARLLVGSQYTFRSNLDEWNDLLRDHGLDAWAVLTEEQMPAGAADDPQRTLVWVLAIQNALDRLHRKWNLSGARDLGDPRLEELLALLLDGVVSGEDVVALLAGDAGQRAAAMERAQGRVHRIDRSRPYPLLSDAGRDRPLLGGDHRWLTAALAAESPAAAAQGVARLQLGDTSGDGGAVVIPGGDTGAEALLRPLTELWLGGVEVRWDRWFEGRGCRTVPLPTYAFARDRHVAGPPPRSPGSRAQAQAPVPEPVFAPKPGAPRLARFWPRWVRQDGRSSAAPAAAAPGVEGPVLVFGDLSTSADGGASVRHALGARELVCVRPGARYRRDSPSSFVLPAAEKEGYERLFEALRGAGPLPARIVHAWGWERRGGGLEERLWEGPESLFLLIQAVMEQRPDAPVEILHVHPHEGGAAAPEHAAVEGLAKSVQRENPNILLRSVALPGSAAEVGPWRRIGEELGRPDKPLAVRWDGDGRWVKRYGEVPDPGDLGNREQPGAGVGPGSVVLVVGGAGGLGLEVARHLLAVPGVRVALAGRSPSSEPVVRRLAALAGGEPQRIAYFQADVSVPREAQDLVLRVRDRFGPLTGVIHAAGVLSDSFVLRKSLADFRRVLAPKVWGAVNLDEATRDEPLEVFVLFSSLLGVTGNPGQAGYTYANAFLDAFARERERSRAAGRRRGRSISIDWPLWEGGGMRVVEQGDTVATADQGLVPMPVAEGLAALDAALSGPAGQWVLVYGDPELARRLLEPAAADETVPARRAWETPAVPPGPAATAAAAGDEATTALALRYLAGLFSQLLEMAAEEVDPQLGLDEYGIDSILISQFNARIERDLGKVSKTLLYECRTLAEVAEVLARRRPGELAALAASAAPAAGGETSGNDAPGEIHREARSETGRASAPWAARLPRRGAAAAGFDRGADRGADGAEEDLDGVAVIGMSGRYPMAAGLDQFWHNLASGRDCISEIPRQRWSLGPEAARDGGPVSEIYPGIYCPWGGFLSDVDRFDPLFFSISPRDAELMDPQERLFLETAWEAFESAGYPPSRLGDPRIPGDRAVGVFVGVTTQSYLLWGPDEWRKGNPVIPTSTPWTVANRVSYTFDLQGPSMPVDTACASSLTAMHLACESLAKGECRMALVGGVNLYLHPSKYEWLCQLEMLSPTGRCHAFGEQADGFVPGEGVGALVLKPLAAAVADGDPILGVVKGSAVNHGGRTHGFMVPSPVAQAELVRRALGAAGVDPRTVGYIEAHGTGTALGDPIEINGLTRAFESAETEMPPGFCAVGSVKSNIGHLEAAAGVAGLTKLVLQLRHRQLVPSLHAETTNPRIDFEASPFRVQRELREWEPVVLAENGRERIYPRRAGISSFGAGGANAHVILEEYRGPRQDRRGEPGGEQLLVLSAQNGERLREHCRRVAAHLWRFRGELRLSEVAHQLQLRREPLPERVAVLGDDPADVAARLEALAEGADPGADGRSWWNHVQRRAGKRGGGRGAVPPPSPGEVDAALERRDLGRLGAAWTVGAQVPWKRLWDGPLQSVELPAYPFADERYWVPRVEEPHGSRPAALGSAAPPPGPAHPFLGAESSAAGAPGFAVELTGEEFFLADHCVDDDRVFPAVAYVEMARAASAALGRPAARVRNSVFSAALTVGAPRRVHIALTPTAAAGTEGSGDSGACDFEVVSFGAAGERILHGHGRVEAAPRPSSGPDPERLDLDAIRRRCPRQVSGAALYPRLHALGLRLGASYQGIREIHAGDGEVLSEIRLPRHLETGFDAFVLHPSILDSAFQGSQVLLDQGKELETLHIPFTLGEVEILGATPEHGFAHVALRGASGGAKKLEVRLSDAEGRVRVHVRDLWVRPWQRPAADAATAGGSDGVFFRPLWREEALPAAGEAAEAADLRLLLTRTAGAGRRLAAELAARGAAARRATFVVTPGSGFRVAPETETGTETGTEIELDPARPADFEALARAAGAGAERADVVFAWPAGSFHGDAGEVGAQLDSGLFPLLHLLHALRRHSPETRLRLLGVLPGADPGERPDELSEGQPAQSPGHGALGGFLRSAGRESTRLSHRLLELPAAELEALSGGTGEAAAAVADELLTPWDATLAGGAEIRRRGGRRWVERWSELPSALAEGRSSGAALLRRRGVYIVTGGAGGIGRLVARWLAAEAEARLVLVGRSEPNAGTEELLRQIADAGGEGLYRCGDVSRAEDAAAVVEAARDAFGPVHGVFHAAGVVRDELWMKKSRESVEEVLAPKVWGALHLDAATRDEPLDLFVLFSSMAAAVGTVGQTDYAYANRFLDLFAGWRHELDRGGRRRGKTVSVAWPTWREGGMRIDEATEEALFESFGVRPMETPAALAALTAALGGDSPALLFVPGDGVKVRRLLGVETVAGREPAAAAAPSPASIPASIPAPAGAGSPGDLLAPLTGRVVEELAELVKLDPSRVDPEAEIGGYGLDSIAFTRLANRLNQVLGTDLTPATFFEHTTLASVTGYLLETYPAELAERLAPAAPVTAVEERAAAAPPAPRAAPAPLVSGPSPAESPDREPIAIVGMHGLLPQSDDLGELWEHLENGRDLVTEIPADRWDWRDFYGDPLTERNKTNSKWGGFVREVDKFDARFFGISPREAELMDPQQRIFLQTTYKAIEEAGYKPSDLGRWRTGLFVGVSGFDYYELLKDAGVPVEAYTTTGMLHGILANRVSYLLNLTGPSFPIDTACSSSLVAVRSAVEAIWAGSCDAAVAGGVNLLIAPMVYISFSRAGMMSPDGRSKTFDESANGYVRGEGAGALLLKRLSSAVADGDHIHAVIRGSAVNHGGRVNTMTTPNPNAQSELIVRAFEEAGIDPETVGFMELHGTGTALGDPIEINGLKKAFGELRRRAGKPPLAERRCWIGSVKTNLGHLEPVAGLAGLFKAILAIRHGRIPPNLHLKKLNPYIQLDGSPFRIAQSLEPWPRRRDDAGRELPRRVGVSSFGFGGVNAHVLLEEHLPPAAETAATEAEVAGEQIVVLSGRTAEALRQRSEQLLEWLAAETEGDGGGEVVDARRVECELGAAAANLLGVAEDEIFPDEAVEDLGFDAVRLGQLWDWIGTTYGIPRSAADETAGRSLAAVARHLCATYPRALARRRGAGNGSPASEGAVLRDLAYTLQVGREAMEHRLAVVVRSTAQLRRRLAAFLAAGAGADGVHVSAEDSGVAGRDGGEPGVETLLDARDSEGLASRWVRGAAVAWERLHGGARPRRLSLPTYPFARTRYWIPGSDAPAEKASEKPSEKLSGAGHPLLGAAAGETGAGGEVTFRKRFAAAERIVGEHRIHGAAVLPGVGHLEMARAALAAVWDEPFRLTGVVWRRPLFVGEEGREVELRLRPEDGRVVWEIRGGADGGAPVLFSQGASEALGAGSEPSPLPLDELRRRCDRGLEVEALHGYFRSMGIEYGAYFRGVREIHVGTGEVLARVAVGEADRGELASWGLHPTLLDAALQSVAALEVSARRQGTRLPFSVDAVELLRPLPASGFVHVREVGPDRFDVTLADETGRVAVLLRQLQVRGEADPLAGFFFRPEWEAAPLAGGAAEPGPGACLIVHPRESFGLEAALAERLGGGEIRREIRFLELLPTGHDARRGDAAGLEARLGEVGSVETVVFLGGVLAHPPGGDAPAAVAELQERGTLGLFRLVRALDAAGLLPGVRSLVVGVNDVQDVGGRRAGNPYAAGLIGLAKSLAKEHPALGVRCLDVGVPAGAVLGEGERRAVAEALLAEPPHRAGEEAALFSGRRHLRRLRPLRLPPAARSAFRRRGTYLIVGGARGIAVQLARHLAQRAAARIILVGRRPASPEIERELAEINARGGEAIYLSGDLTDLERMREVVAETRARFGEIHGVVHAAMVLADGIVTRLEEADFRSALAPKTEGSAVLDVLFRHEPLDFLLFMSSAQSFAGAAGQGNYAAACTFEDVFARSLAGRAAYPVKIVNWGFWGTVGSVATEDYRRRMAERGVGSISPEEGMEAVERILASPERQVVAIKADAAGLAEIGAVSAPPPELAALPPVEPLAWSPRDAEEQAAFGVYLAHALLDRLQRSGVLRRSGERTTVEEMAGRLSALPKYRRLVGGLVEILARHRLVRLEGSEAATAEVVAAEAIGGEALVRALEALGRRGSELASTYPGLAPRLDLLGPCLAALPEVLTGAVAATEVLFPGGSLERVAAVHQGNRLGAWCNDLCAAAAAAFLRSGGAVAAGGSSTPLAVLEIGAGTGGTTARVVEALQDLDARVSYDYTDVSAKFLGPAERRFGGRLPQMRFRPLDIEKPVEAQGFTPGGYDVVLAAGVLHATRDLDTALAQVRRLLAPGGRLILNEPTRIDDFYTLTFGLLDGWWLYEDQARRLPASPLLDVEMWRSRLTAAGFGPLEVLGESGDGREPGQRVIVAAAAPARRGEAADEPRTTAVPEAVPDWLTESPAPPGFPAGVAEPSSGRRGGFEMTESRETTHPGEGGAQTGAPDREALGARLEALIAQLAAASLNMPPEEIGRTQALSSFGVDSIVGVELINQLNQRLGIVLKTIVIFDYPNVRELAAHILETHPAAVTQALGSAAADPASEPAPPEASPPPAAPPPVSPPPAPPSAVSPASSVPPARLRGGAFQAVRFERPGRPEDLRIAPLEPVAPGPGEVEIQVEAFPINFSDLLLAKGLYPMMPDYPFTPGVEVAGVVRRVGPGVTRVSVGDAVIAATRPQMGGQASVVVTDADFAVRKPDNVSFEEACGFPVPFIAMYLACERAQLRRGERVLIHAATGTNGLVAVQLAQLAGAEIFATAGSRAKVEHLRRMGVEHAIAYREMDFAEEILRQTGGRGVDVILDTVGGDVLQKGLDVLAPGGRYVELAVFGLQASKDVSLSRLIDNQTFFSINSKKIFVHHPQERVRYLDLMASYLESGKVRPVVARVFPFERVAEAYAAKQDRETIGRIVVSFGAAGAAPERPAVTAAVSAAAPAPHPAAAPRRTLDIAVVGLACRYPGAEDAGQLWANLAAGVSSIREVPASRWSNARFFDPDPTRRDRTYCKHGGFLDDVEMFDAAFFQISGKEAEQTDPQQRLFLEESWRALEDAGYPSGELDATSCGVFVGAGGSDYLTRMNKAGVVKQAQAFWGNDTSVLAARISYFLNLKGPAITLNTACSSSLVALHLACRSLASGECEMALAGGVFLAMAPDYFIVATNGNMMSPEGRSKTFDDSADGFGPGEGVGVVVLKPLERALADGDHIYGVVAGSAVNQDGRTNGITAPSSRSQSEVELAVYERHGIDPGTLGYIEAHGTGTRLGDPIEIEALTHAFREYTAKKQFCPIGSIKTNIGHTAAAAGIAGVIKVLLSFQHRQIPASLGFHRPNRHIDFEASPFFVNTELSDWPAESGRPRRAAVSSFGFSGTNAHVVLEEPPAVSPSAVPPPRPRPLCLVPLSAATPGSLRRRIEQLARWLGGEGARLPLAEISYNLQLHRDHFRERAAWIARDTEDLRRRLEAELAGDLAATELATELAETGGEPVLALAELTALAARYRAGETVDWRELWAGERCRRLSLPLYPFERERYWYAEDDTTYTDPVPSETASSEAAGEPALRLTLSGREPFLDGHRVGGRKVLPGVVCLELARRAAEAAGLAAAGLRDLVWLRPVVVGDEPVDLSVHLAAGPRREGEGVRFELSSTVPGGGEAVHARGEVLWASVGRPPQRADLAQLLHVCPSEVDPGELYARLRAGGLVHGPFLAAVEQVWAGEGQVLARLRLPAEARESFAEMPLHPALLDGALQVLAAFDGGGDGADRPSRLPVSVREVALLGALPEECWAHVSVLSGVVSGSLRSYDVRLLDGGGRELVVLSGLSIKGAQEIAGAPEAVPETAPEAAAAGNGTNGADRSNESSNGGSNGGSRPETRADLLAVLARFAAGEIGEDDADRLVEVILDR